MTGCKAPYWDRITESWQKTRPQTLWRLHSDAINLKLLENWLPQEPVELLLKTDMFDEAIGSGLYPLLASRAITVIGMDISALTLRAAITQHNGLCAVGADARRLPFADGVFDVIVSNSTLDHFESPHKLAESLCELHRVLKLGGLLLVTLDNRANPIVALRNALPFPLANRLGVIPYYVGATLGPKGMRRNLQQLGFKVRDVSAVMHCPRMLAVFTASLLQRHTATQAQRRFLKLLMSFERLSRWPTRFLTGYFVAALAEK